MGLIVILPFAAMAVYVIAGIHRWLRRASFGPEWWRAYRLLALGGLALGLLFVFAVDYGVANKRIAGFPIPLAIATQEKGQWVRTVTPPSIHYPGMIADVLSGVAFALIPLAVAAFYKENRGKFIGPARPPAPNP